VQNGLEQHVPAVLVGVDLGLHEVVEPAGPLEAAVNEVGPVGGADDLYRFGRHVVQLGAQLADDARTQV